MAILFEFAMRLAFGLALALAVTSHRQVTSGYFRNHLYVTMGLCVLSTLVAVGAESEYLFALTAAVLSYVGSVCWLYERSRAGTVVAGLVATSALVAALLAGPPFTMGELVEPVTLPVSAVVLWCLTPLTGGLVLGFTIGAMFLGHWYLNTPTMQMAPLDRLLALMVLALVIRAVICGLGLWWTWSSDASVVHDRELFLSLRWLTGIVAPLILAWMVARTLAIPNTQSATGILYVAVITTFTGELMAQLLSVDSVYPL